MRAEIASAALRPVPRRGLRRDEAAAYVGISPSKFDQLVRERRMPQPLRIDGCTLWDIRALDSAFDALAGVEDGGWDFAP